MSKITRIILGALLIFLVCGCATEPKNEDEAYLQIKGAMAGDRYSYAASKIYIFEKKYPESRYTCELLQILVAYEKNSNLNPNKSQKQYDEKCTKKVP